MPSKGLSSSTSFVSTFIVSCGSAFKDAAVNARLQGGGKVSVMVGASSANRIRHFEAESVVRNLRLEARLDKTSKPSLRLRCGAEMIVMVKEENEERAWSRG